MRKKELFTKIEFKIELLKMELFQFKLFKN